MPEQPESEPEKSSVAHYVVIGEGARDNEWTDGTPASRLLASRLPEQSFQLLPIPPSTKYAIVPLVRVFGCEGPPSPATKFPRVSNVSNMAPLPVEQLSSALAESNIHSNSQSRVEGDVQSSAAPVSYGASGPPRHLSTRGCRMIAHPALNHATPIANSGPTTAVRQQLPDERGPSKIPSVSGTKNRNERNILSPEDAELDLANVENNSRLFSAKSISNTLASDAQSAALKEFVRNQKKLYQPTKSLPPILADPAIQAAHAARMHASTRHEESQHGTAASASGHAERVQRTSGTSSIHHGRSDIQVRGPTIKTLDNNSAPSTKTSEPPSLKSLRTAGSSEMRAKEERDETAVIRDERSSTDCPSQSERLSRATKVGNCDTVPSENSQLTQKRKVANEANARRGSLPNLHRRVPPERHAREGIQASMTERSAKSTSTIPARAIVLEGKNGKGSHTDQEQRDGELLSRRRGNSDQRTIPSQKDKAPANAHKTNSSSTPNTTHSGNEDFNSGSKKEKARHAQLQRKPPFSKGLTCGVDLQQKLARGSLHVVTTDNSSSTSGVKGKNCSDLMTEPFEYCIKLLVQSLCLSGSASGSGISKEVTTRFRRELRTIFNLESRSRLPQSKRGILKGPHNARDQKAPTAATNDTAPLHGGRKAALILRQEAGPVVSPTKVAEKPGYSRSSSRILASDATAGIVHPRSSEHGARTRAQPVDKSDAMPSSQTPISSALHGIQFTFIRWQLAIQQKQVKLENVAREAREIADTCKSLMNPVGGTPRMQDREVIEHVVNLNLAGIPIRYILTQIASLSEVSASSYSPQRSAMRNLEHALDALRDILIWAKYIADEVSQLHRKYEEDASERAEVKRFLAGITTFISYSQSEARLGFISELKEYKKYFLHSANSKDDGRPFYARRQALGDDVRSILLTFRRVAVWWKRQTSTKRRNVGAMQSATATSADPANEVPNPSVAGRKGPSEKVKNVLKANPQLQSRTTDAAVLEKAYAHGESHEKEANEAPSVHDAKAAPKRQGSDISDVKMRRAAVGSSSEIVPGSTKARAIGQLGVGSGRLDAKAPSVARTKGKESFNPMALLKSISDARNTHHREDGIRSESRSAKNPVAGTSAWATTSQTSRPRKPLNKGEVEKNINAEERSRRPLKRRRRDDHVSFATDLVVGTSNSNIQKADNLSLFHDGYDLLGRENPIQEEAVNERASHLTRGSVIALFGYLRSEFIRMKNESEGRETIEPEFLSLIYPPSASKQIAWHAKKDTPKAG
ncbi:unnamed protein product [Chondrus crispus]|uniref:Uncharacterized protein n=1 Tax=Chondrus crispus TaxID=2769 RepID=R7QEE5_CHOCR|nr:unnamed protein product [Chondrus crispus]CDF36133.1 unnamed protein product [Chondrus crispus]|eukprot:XP_005715952.1 unnamed protein product [Chondrus crispus]